MDQKERIKQLKAEVQQLVRGKALMGGLIDCHPTSPGSSWSTLSPSRKPTLGIESGIRTDVLPVIAGSLESRARRASPGCSLRTALPPAARLLEQAGDRQSARAHYLRFLELWKHADADFPELAEARMALSPKSPETSR